MTKENNKMQVDIENLFKQNVNDLSAIKELYRKLKDIENKISQIKYIDNTLANKLKKEYEKLKKIILDENAQAKLANEIEIINSILVTKTSKEETKNVIETINSQMINKANLNEVIKKGQVTLNECDENMLAAIQNKEGETSFSLLSIPRDKSVDYTKTNFLQLDTDINLFGGVYLDGYELGKSSFPLQLRTTSSRKLIAVSVKPNTNYTIIKDFVEIEDGYYWFKVATDERDISTLFSSVPIELNGSVTKTATSTLTNYFQITTGKNDKTLLVQVSTNQEPFTQIVEGHYSDFTTDKVYPIIPKKISIYSKNEVDNLIEEKTKKLYKNIFSKAGTECTIRMGKAEYVFKKITDSSINVNAWRLYSGNLIDVNNDNAIVGKMWSNSDAEGAIQILGEEDFVSGYHGDETFSSINILIDDSLIDLKSDYNNLEFKNIKIISESVVYHCNTSNKSGKIAFNRVKTLEFTDNTVKINNRYICKDNMLINRAALSLFNCYKTYNGTKFFTHYSTNDDLKLYEVPNTNEISLPYPSPNMTEATFYTTIGAIKFKILRGQNNPNYKGSIANFDTQNRMKIYFDYIASSTSGTQVNDGDILQSEFQFTIE